MRSILTLCLAAVVGLSACDDPTQRTPMPSGASGTGAPRPSEAVDLELLLGPWRHEPLAVPEDLRELLVSACADSATEAGIDVTDLAPAVVDARGAGRATLILASERAAMICEAQIGPGGDVRIDVPAARVAPESAEPIADDGIDIVGYTAVDDDGAGLTRTVLYGRVGRLSSTVKVGFDDESEAFATTGSGWYAAWWPGAARPVTVAAVDLRSVAVASVEPVAYVEGRAGYAHWWVDPMGPRLTPDATTIQAILVERSCASGSTPEGRILEPDVFYGEDAILVTMWVRHKVGGQDCQGNPTFPTTLRLSEALGERGLLDGSEVPPRDATVPAQ